jgi:hypothetical protein
MKNYYYLKLSIVPVVIFLLVNHCETLTYAPTTNPSIRVTSPAAGSSWIAGATDTVRWGSSGSIGELVMIGLYNDTGMVITIAAGAANSGRYPWTIPMMVPGGYRYRIIIKSVMEDSISGSSGIFTILNYADAYEPDDPASLATLIDTMGTIQYHNLTFHDTDWYRFEAHEGRSYCIRTYGTTNTFIDLFATDTHTLLLNNDNGGTDSNAMIVWTCPSSGTYYFRVTEKGTSKVPALPYSVNVRTSGAILALVYPDSGCTFVSDSTITVLWQYSSNSENDVVSLFVYRNDTLAATIASGTSNNGSYSWIVPHALPTSPLYRIKIVSGNDTTVNDSSGFFTITNVPASFTITTPSTATQWNTGASDTIRWSYSGNPGPSVSLRLYNYDSLVKIIASGTGTGNGQFSWIVPTSLPNSSGYRIKIASVNDTAICAFSTPFTITKIPSTLTVSAPSSTANWNTGTAYTIRWSSSGNPGLSAYLSLYNGDTLVTDIFDSITIAAKSCVWTVPWKLPTSSRYHVRITSLNDTTVTGFSDSFIITAVPPIRVTTPSTGTIWTAGLQNYIYWNSGGNVPGNNVTIYLCNGSTRIDTIASDVIRANNNYSWTLPATLRDGSTYRIQVVSTADTSLYGYSGYFTIAALPNRLTITLPAKGTGWTADDYYTIYWSYSGPDLTDSYVTLTLYDSSLFVDTIAPNAYATNGLFLWHIPSSLASNSRYRIKIASNIIDSVSDFSDTFTITNPALIGDSYEPDDSYAQATLIAKGDPAQSHTLSSLDDEDWLKFNAVSGTTYTIETQGATDTYLNLYGTDGVTLLASGDDISGLNTNSRIVWTCTTSGVYYFAAAGWDVGSYTVTLR